MTATYPTIGMPATADGLEFALDADVWFHALLTEPSAFFSEMPAFQSLQAYGSRALTGMAQRRSLKKTGNGYVLDITCPQCQRRVVVANKRAWAKLIFNRFVQNWDNPAMSGQFKNQVASYFLKRYQTVVEKKLPIVFNGVMKTGQIRKIIVWQPGEAK